MPILRLIAEGVGPFESLDIDFSDGNGKPHLGPHILAGVNGSGKSTVLRTIAWVLDRGALGFQYEDWQESLGEFSHALLAMDSLGLKVQAVCKFRMFQDLPAALEEWVRASLPSAWTARMGKMEALNRPGGFYASWMPSPFEWYDLLAAYSSSRALRHLASPDLTKRLESPYQNSLGFESTVRNDFVQSWLLGLYSKMAIARERKEPSSDYSRLLALFERALSRLFGEEVVFDVEIEPAFQPRLKVRGKRLNFSQLPDGMRSTIAWISDFMMRQEMMKWNPELKGKHPGVLLLDEVDAHLHPLWQRHFLPAMREALPDVQIIVTSHSPFVISSCQGARVHVLETDDRGHAHAHPPIDSPFGESVTATLKDIFGVDSRFDITTEAELND